VTNIFFDFAWGPTPTLAAGAFDFAWARPPALAAGADSLSPPFEPREPQAPITIPFDLDDDPDDDLDDDEFGDDEEEGEDEEDGEDDDEDPDTETWQVSPFRGARLKAGFRLTSRGELPRLAPISQLI
jgi:hypothetical protein